MRLLAAAAIAACVVGVAVAQEPPPDDGRFSAEWEVRGEFARYYPDAALERNVSGAVELCYTPRPDRHVDCRVGFEWPQGFGFGEGALRAMGNFRMTPASHAAFQANPDNFMQIPVRFSVGGMRAEQRRAMDRITQETRGLCRRPGAPVS